MANKMKNKFCVNIEKFYTHAKNIMGTPTFWLLIISCLIVVVGFFSSKDLFTCAALLIATAAITYQTHQAKLRNNQENSKFYLEKYIQTVGMILDRLKADSPTRRIAWVSAAALAEKIKTFDEKITEKSDKDFLDIYQRNLAHLIHEFISPKSAQYFYDVDEAKNLNEAYEESKTIKPHVTPGLMPRFRSMTFVEPDDIKKIIDLEAKFWEKAAGYTYKNNTEFLSAMNLQYLSEKEGVASYLRHFNSRKKNEATPENI